MEMLELNFAKLLKDNCDPKLTKSQTLAEAPSLEKLLMDNELPQLT
jgi:hypothetical protein